MELQAHASINVDGTGNVLGESKFPKVVALLGGISLPDVTTYYKANLLTRWFTLIVPPQDPMVREMAALQHGELLDKHLWTPDLTTLRDPHFDPLLKRTMPNLASPDKRLTDLLVNKERLDKDALQTLIGNKQISFLHYQHFRHSIASLPRPVTTDEPMSKFKRMVVLKSPRNRRLANSKAALLDTIPDSKPGYLSAWEAELGTQSPQRKLNPTKVGGPTNPTNPTKISYGATDPSLSDRLLYPHVFRTVQNSHIHNMVMTELLEHFGWTWVGILVSDDDNGELELQILRKYMKERGICVAYTIKYTYEITEYNDQILQVLHNPQVRVIILCGTFNVYNRSLVVDFSSQTFQAIKGFEKNFKKLPNIFKEESFWEDLDIMIKEEKDSFISVMFELQNHSFPFIIPSIRSFLTSGVSPRLYEAVEVLAKALHEMFLYIKDKSPENPITRLTQYTQKLQRHLQRMKSPLKTSKSSCLLSQFPVSRCSEPCLPGSRKKTRPTIHICCYDCAPCSEGEISNVTDADSCSKCQSDEWPNEKRDRCLPKVMEFISYHNDTIASVSSSISLFGCLVTGSIFRIFISYRDTPIVKANNRNLSYLLLVSIILSFLSVFLFLGRPSDVTCRLRETSFGVFFSVAVSSLLAKTVMVCVAFKSTKPGSPWRKWLSVKLPYTIVLLCSSFQVVICILWLSISPPFQDLDTQSYPEKIIIQCNEGSDLWFYSMLGYMGLLAAVSFLLAFMVRTLPDSFNEAKYITFSMLLFCSVWMAMIPAYLSTRGKYMVAVEIFAVMASSAGLLACVFFPKCFIILFRSEMNRKTDLLGRRKEICNNSNK
ncbi:vomeronasal type-2 receptor 26-like [Leptodactylus fuscus]